MLPKHGTRAIEENELVRPPAHGPRPIREPGDEDDRPLLSLCLVDRHDVHDPRVSLDALLFLADLVADRTLEVTHELLQRAVDAPLLEAPCKPEQALDVLPAPQRFEWPVLLVGQE